MADTIQIRRGTTSAWNAANPVLALGEQGYDTTTKQYKVGDGTTAWTALAYSTPGHIAANTVLANPSGALANPVGVDAAGMRSLIGAAGTGVANTFTGVQTFTNQRLLRTTDAGSKFNLDEDYEYNTFGGTCEDHVYYVGLNKTGSVLTHPVFGIGIENFFITNLGQKLVEVNWDYISIDRSVQYRPMAFAVDCDTHLATYVYVASRTVNTRTNVTGTYLVDNIECGATTELYTQVKNTHGTGKANNYLVATAGDVATIYSTNGNAAYVGVDASTGKMVIGRGNTINQMDLITLDESIQEVTVGTKLTVNTTGVRPVFANDFLKSNDTKDRFAFYANDVTEISGAGTIPIRFRNGLGAVLAEIKDTGAFTFTTAGWHTSIDGLNRLFFSSSSTTWFTGHGVTPFIWRSGDDVIRLQVDSDNTSGNTRFLLWDNSTGTLKRIKVGANDSGGTGFRMLRIDN